MKKIILYLFLSAISSSQVFAQLNFSTDTASVVMEPGVPHKAIIEISNNSGHDINIRWQLINSTLKDNDGTNPYWNLQYCECNNCYTNDFGLLPTSGICNAPMADGTSIEWYLTVDPGSVAMEHAEWIVEVTNVTDNLVDTLVYYVEAPNAVKNVSYNAEVTSYPNPANDELTIVYALENVNNPELKVYNVLGANVLSLPISNQQGKLNLNTSMLENGLYFFTIEEAGQRVFIQKFSVAR